MSRRGALLVAVICSGCFDAATLVEACVDGGRCVFAGPDGSTTEPDAGDPCAPPQPASSAPGLFFGDTGFLALRLRPLDAGALGFLEQFSFDSDGGALTSIPLSLRTDAGLVLFDTGDASQHALSRSEDGRFITTVAYLVPDSTSGLPITVRPGVSRVVLRINAAGAVELAEIRGPVFGPAQDMTPRLIRAATTTTGSRVWAVGNAAGLQSLPFSPLAETTPIFTVPGDVSHVHAGLGSLFVTTRGAYNSFFVVALSPANQQSCSTPTGVTGLGVAAPTTTATIPAPRGPRLLVGNASGVHEFALNGTAATLLAVRTMAGATQGCTHLAVNENGEALCRTTADVVSTVMAADAGIPRVVLPSRLPASVWRGVAFPPR